MTISLVSTAGTASTAEVRGHSLTFDRPGSKGGHDAGPMGGEAFLASIGGCFMSTLVAAAAAREVELSGVRCTVVGTFADSPRRFGRITITASSAEGRSDEFAHLVRIGERGCLVLNTLRHLTGTAVAVEVGTNG